MAAPSLASLRNGYQNLWDSCVIDKNESLVERVAKKLTANEARYRKVADQFGMPWQIIAVIHQRESGANFSGVLHNGEKIIGTGRKTRLVPKGRGPFNSWEEAAIDALKLRKTDAIKTWDIPQILYYLEGYNGFGYFYKGKNSPYLWSHTNHYKDSAGDVGDPEGGKYVADGRYDPNHYDAQIGVVALLKKLPPMMAKPKPSIPGVEKPAEPISKPSEPVPPKENEEMSTVLRFIYNIFGWV